MFVFIIPVKSKQVSGSWHHFERLFERTLKSVCNQTSDMFRVIVACHEKPEISYTHRNVEYLPVEFPIPKLDPKDDELNISLKEADKGNKILAAYQRAKTYSPDYVMVVDADDCISKNIVEYALKNRRKSPDGWYFKSGYMYKEGTNYLTLNKNNFNTLCGTCVILNPKLLPLMFEEKPHLIYKHRFTDFGSKGSLVPYPDAATIYSMANGENHYMSTEMIKSLSLGKIPNISAFIASVIRKIKRYRIKPLSSTIKSEFGLYNVK